MRSARTSSIRRATCGWSRSSAPRTPTRRSRRRSPSSRTTASAKAWSPPKDTPNFIANRIGLYGVMQIFRAWTQASDGGYTIEEIDAITGPAIGRPKSATFRTMDLAGIDVLAHVVRNLADSLSRDDDRAVFALPPIVEATDRARLGRSKAGQGFYKKDASGEILTLDPASMTYRPAAPARLPSLDAARAIEDPGARIKALFAGQGQGRPLPARHARPHAASTPHESPRRSPTPSTTWTARCSGALAGSSGRSRPGMRSASSTCSTRATSPTLRRSSATRWRVAPSGRSGDGRPYERVPPGRRRACNCCGRPRSEPPSCGGTPAPAWSTSATSVLGVEFHSKMNAIGGDTIQMLQAGVKEAAARLPRARRRQRRAELLRRREPDAAPARSAGGQLGRDRPDGPRLPGRHDGAEVRRRAGRRRACGAGARRRMRGRAPRATACRRRRKPTWGWSRSASA